MDLVSTMLHLRMLCGWAIGGKHSYFDATGRRNPIMISFYSPAMRREFLSKHILMSTLPQRALDDLAKYTTIARFEPHRVIFSKSDPGDCLYGIISGRVRIFSTSREGDEIVLEILESGKLFGELAFLVGSPRTASAAAMEQTALMRIHRDHFLPYVRDNPDLLLSFLRLLCNRLRESSEIIEDTAFLPLPARLAKRLLTLGEHYCRPGMQVITVPVSQRELGSMVGVSRETANKQLAIWRSAGIVDTARGTTIIRNSEALRELVGCG
jgi:CRP/FNR family transcriptional regulator, cyclic AMP receptor protein